MASSPENKDYDGVGFPLLLTPGNICSPQLSPGFLRRCPRSNDREPPVLASQLFYTFPDRPSTVEWISNHAPRCGPSSSPLARCEWQEGRRYYRYCRQCRVSEVRNAFRDRGHPAQKETTEIPAADSSPVVHVVSRRRQSGREQGG